MSTSLILILRRVRSLCRLGLLELALSRGFGGGVRLGLLGLGLWVMVMGMARVNLLMDLIWHFRFGVCACPFGVLFYAGISFWVRFFGLFCFDILGTEINDSVNV